MKNILHTSLRVALFKKEKCGELEWNRERDIKESKRKWVKTNIFYIFL